MVAISTCRRTNRGPQLADAAVLARAAAKGQLWPRRRPKWLWRKHDRSVKPACGQGTLVERALDAGPGPRHHRGRALQGPTLRLNPDPGPGLVPRPGPRWRPALTLPNSPSPTRPWTVKSSRDTLTSPSSPPSSSPSSATRGAMTPAEVVGRDSGVRVHSYRYALEEGGTTDHLVFILLTYGLAKHPRKNSSSSAPHPQAQPGEPGQPQPNPYPTP